MSLKQSLIDGLKDFIYKKPEEVKLKPEEVEIQISFLEEIAKQKPTRWDLNPVLTQDPDWDRENIKVSWDVNTLGYRKALNEAISLAEKNEGFSKKADELKTARKKMDQDLYKDLMADERIDKSMIEKSGLIYDYHYGLYGPVKGEIPSIAIASQLSGMLDKPEEEQDYLKFRLGADKFFIGYMYGESDRHSTFGLPYDNFDIWDAPSSLLLELFQELEDREQHEKVVEFTDIIVDAYKNAKSSMVIREPFHTLCNFYVMLDVASENAMKAGDYEASYKFADTMIGFYRQRAAQCGQELEDFDDFDVVTFQTRKTDALYAMGEEEKFRKEKQFLDDMYDRAIKKHEENKPEKKGLLQWLYK